MGGGGGTVRDVIGVATAIVGLAALAVIFTSPRSAAVIGAGGDAFARTIKAATLQPE